VLLSVLSQLFVLLQARGSCQRQSLPDARAARLRKRLVLEVVGVICLELVGSPTWLLIPT